jgi:hypothetical protein
MRPSVVHLRRDPGTLSHRSLIRAGQQQLFSRFQQLLTVLRSCLCAGMYADHSTPVCSIKDSGKCKNIKLHFKKFHSASHLQMAVGQLNLESHFTSSMQQSKRQRLSGSLTHSKSNDVAQAGIGQQPTCYTQLSYRGSSLHTPMHQRPARDKAPALAQSRKRPLRWLHQGTANAENVSPILFQTTAAAYLLSRCDMQRQQYLQ